MKDKQSDLNAISLPPRLPQNRQELDRAIILLGCRKQAELSTHTRRELAELIGVYPTVEEATLWKRVLRRACQDVIRQEE
jgi:hypothetical protein